MLGSTSRRIPKSYTLVWYLMMAVAKRRFRWLNMILSEGVLDLLEFLGDGKPRYFKQFRELENERTGSKYSPTTISSRLKGLIKQGLVEHTLTETGTGRKVAGYRITRKGVKALKLSHEYENKLRKITEK